MTIDEVINILSKLTVVLQVGLIVVILAIIGAAAYMGLLLLSFGHKAFELALPYAQQLLNVLATERHKYHPAISVERYLQYFFGGIAILCIGVFVLHALIPWKAHHMEFIAIVLVSCIAVTILLAPVSIYTALRLP